MYIEICTLRSTHFKAHQIRENETTNIIAVPLIIQTTTASKNTVLKTFP